MGIDIYELACSLIMRTDVQERMEHDIIREKLLGHIQRKKAEKRYENPAIANIKFEQ
jgi:hypothetical protein